MKGKHLSSGRFDLPDSVTVGCSVVQQNMVPVSGTAAHNLKMRISHIPTYMYVKHQQLLRMCMHNMVM